MTSYFGTNGSDYIKGEGFQNSIDGFGGDDVLIGNDHSDVLDGGEGDDFLVGGGGSDYFQFWLGHTSEHDTIFDFNPNEGDESIELKDVHPWDVTIEQDGNDTLITYSGSFIESGVTYASTSQITVVGVQVSDLHVENGDHGWGLTIS